MKSLLLGALLLLLGGAAIAGAQRVVEIENPERIATEDARHQLKYLASCALDKDTILRGSIGDQNYDFPGSMGLAPHWGDAPLTVTQRRWVSACVLARTNAFGAHVLISMRSAQGVHEALNALPDELASHTLYEGGFFGDIFADDAVAYVCVGADHAEGISAREDRKRVCTHAAAQGSKVTRCAFISVGLCPQGTPPVVDGKPWPEIIHVWLAKDDAP